MQLIILLKDNSAPSLVTQTPTTDNCENGCATHTLYIINACERMSTGINT